MGSVVYVNDSSHLHMPGSPSPWRHTVEHDNGSLKASLDGGRMTSDGVTLLLREADSLFDATRRVAGAFADCRDPGGTGHDVTTAVAQRIVALALGWEDLDDHDRLRDDPALAVACVIDDVEEGMRVRERDRGHVPAASSTLNRLELSVPDEAGTDRDKKVVADHDVLDRLPCGPVPGEPRRGARRDCSGSRCHRRSDPRPSGRQARPRRRRSPWLPAAPCRLRRAHPVLPAAIRRGWRRSAARGPRPGSWHGATSARNEMMAWCEAHDVPGCGQNSRLNAMISRELEAALPGAGQGVQTPSAPGCSGGRQGHRDGAPDPPLPCPGLPLAGCLRPNPRQPACCSPGATRATPAPSRRRPRPASPADVGKGVPGVRHGTATNVRKRPSTSPTCHNTSKIGPGCPAHPSSPCPA